MGDLNVPIFLELRRAILADGLRHGVLFAESDLECLALRLGTEGRSFAFETLPLLGKALERGLVGGHLLVPTNFSCRKLTLLPELCHAVFRLIFSEAGILLSDPCLTSIKYLRHFLSFDSKLVSTPTVEQERDAIEGFQLRQSDLRKVRLPVEDPVLEGAVRLLTKVLRNHILHRIQPNHGPGAVAERVAQDEKWSFKSWPKRAEKYYPYLTYGVYPMLPYIPTERVVSDALKSVSRIVLVPKDFRGPRLISAESTATQYLQQGQMSALMRYIDRHPLLKKSIRLRDQTLNQTRSLQALDSGLVTLDLSDASDTVSCALVWKLFSGVPDLRRRLFATRSQSASFRKRNGELIEIPLVAFAPMGSAVCFPVETLVFWALAMSACHRDPVYRHESWDTIASQVAVFGDDIIIPDTTLHFLQATLRRIGCKPNVDKTCWQTPMRESCGSEWFKNQDITIIRNRRFTYEDPKTFSQYHVLLDLSRQLWHKGLCSAASVCSEWAERIHPVLHIDYHRAIDTSQIRKILIVNDGRVSGTVGIFDPVRRTQQRFALGNFWLPSPSKSAAYAADVEERHPSHTTMDIALVGSRESSSRAPHGDWLLSAPENVSQFPVSFCPGENRVKSRWNKDLHRVEYKLPVVLQKTRVWTPESDQRLLARLLGINTERVVARGCKAKVTWVWVPPAMVTP